MRISIPNTWYEIYRNNVYKTVNTAYEKCVRVKKGQKPGIPRPLALVLTGVT
jgi:hypothetical protein